MTSDMISTQAGMSGTTSVPDPEGKPAKVRGQMKDGRPRSLVSMVAMAVLCVLWTVPTIGLLVTSFRTRSDAAGSGWWTLLWPGNWSDAGFTTGNYHEVLNSTQPPMKDAFINSLGWSEAEWHEYWSNPAYSGTGRDAQEFDESWDAFDAFIEQLRRGGR